MAASFLCECRQWRVPAEISVNIVSDLRTPVPESLVAELRAFLVQRNVHAVVAVQCPVCGVKTSLGALRPRSR